MAVSSNVIRLVKEFEGFRANPYWDYEQWTWGYGTKAPGEHGTISRSAAEAELSARLAFSANAINKYLINKGVPLNQNQFDALLSLVYNLGEPNIFTRNYNNGFSSGSTLYNKLLARDYQGAADQFDVFIRAGGQVLPALVVRRAKEKELFLSGGSSTASVGKASIVPLIAGVGIAIVALIKFSK